MVIGEGYGFIAVLCLSFREIHSPYPSPEPVSGMKQSAEYYFLGDIPLSIHAKAMIG